MKCSNCGREVSGKFCKYCGSALSVVTEEKNASTAGFKLSYIPMLICPVLLLLVSICLITPLGGRLVSYVKNIPVGIRNGCSVGEVLDKQEAILQYTNEDIRELKVLSAELSTVLVALSDNRDGEGEQMQDELAISAVMLADEQAQAAASVAKNISDEEIEAVHQLYVDYCSIMSEAITLIVTAYDNEDAAVMEEANEKAKTANELGKKYNDALMKLTVKYNLTVDKEP